MNWRCGIKEYKLALFHLVILVLLLQADMCGGPEHAAPSA
jgi:hypothetical protein